MFSSVDTRQRRRIFRGLVTACIGLPELDPSWRNHAATPDRTWDGLRHYRAARQHLLPPSKCFEPSKMPDTHTRRTQRLSLPTHADLLHARHHRSNQTYDTVSITIRRTGHAMIQAHSSDRNARTQRQSTGNIRRRVEH